MRTDWLKSAYSKTRALLTGEAVLCRKEWLPFGHR